MTKIVAWAEHVNKGVSDEVVDNFVVFEDDDQAGIDAKYAELLLQDNLHSASVCDVVRSTDYDQTPNTKADAERFNRELLDSVESIMVIGEIHGMQTLTDLIYLQAAILDGSFIDHFSEASAIDVVVKALPSAAEWMSYIRSDAPTMKG